MFRRFLGPSSISGYASRWGRGSALRRCEVNQPPIEVLRCISRTAIMWFHFRQSRTNTWRKPGVTAGGDDLLTQRGIGSIQPLEEPLEEARRGERTRIARQLHAGILQELTVAGFQLKALHDQVPKASRPAVDDLASWLEMRQ